MITQALEENWSEVSSVEGCAKYIANRPRAERIGSHGLFGDEDYVNYAVTVLSDCTSSKTPEIQESNLRDMANVGAVIVSSKEIIEGSERA